MSKYIWLKEDKPKQTAIMLDKIDSLGITYEAATNLCHTFDDRYVLYICTPTKTYAETYTRENEAYNRMDEILGLIEEQNNERD